MKIGLALPNSGTAAARDALVQAAVGAEAIGLDSVWVIDRWLRPRRTVVMPGVAEPVQMPASYGAVFDPIETLTYIAALTRRVSLGTSAINALLQPPVLLARRLATLDQLSGGRVMAGLTPGWMAEEFAAAGQPARPIGHRLDHQVAALRAVWGPDPVRYQSSTLTIPESDIGPKPIQVGGIPLFIGYTTPAGIRRAARIGDGLHPYRNDLAHLAADIALFRAAAHAAGRDPAGLPIVLRANASLDDTTADDDRRPLFHGDTRRWADDLARLAAMGVEHVFLSIDAPIEDALESLARLRDHAPAAARS